MLPSHAMVVGNSWASLISYTTSNDLNLDLKKCTETHRNKHPNPNPNPEENGERVGSHFPLGTSNARSV